MAKGFKHGGCSLPLNFKVICNPQPERAKENTIWVDTDRINNYYFSATQPENMAEYDVWFPVGTYSNVAFSVTKKNPIMVYPLSAKQYIGGALVDVTAKSYQGGEWVEWIIVLWNASKNYENTNVLGSNGFRITANNTEGGTLSKSSAGMVLNSTRNDNIVGVSHDTAIDFTGKTQLIVSWSGGNDYEDYQGIGVFESNAKFKSADSLAFLHKNNTVSETVTLNVSAINQNAYIVIAGYNGALTVSDIKLK